MNKTLTIIIPSYNMEKYLERCLTSLIIDDGLMDHFEALIINDGSKDRTSEIGHQYEAKYPGTFRVVDKENGHYGSCVNAGLARAQGKYVKILDADDSFDIYFNEYLEFLRKTDADLILSDYIEVDDNNNVIRKKEFQIDNNIIQPIGLLAASDDLQIHHARIAYRTALLLNISYQQTEGISYTDLEWDTLPFASISTFAYFPKVLYRYLRGREGQSIDITYQKKNMWMKGDVLLGLARKYESIKDNLDYLHQSMLQKSILGFIRYHYYEYLLLYPNVMDESEVRVFDSKLLNASNEIYRLLEPSKDIRRFGAFPFIKDFRTKGSRPRLKYMYFDICMKLGALCKGIIRSGAD